jgi:hypothetical protein
MVVYTGFLSKRGRFFRKHIYRPQYTPDFYANGMKFLFCLCIVGYILFGAAFPTMK